MEEGLSKGALAMPTASAPRTVCSSGPSVSLPPWPGLIGPNSGGWVWPHQAGWCQCSALIARRAGRAASRAARA